MSSKQLSILDKFAKELKGFARTAEGPGSAPELVATRTPSEAHTSVRAVQGFLPYRQQFQHAGRAIASAEQKIPPTSEKRAERLVLSLTDDRLRSDGGAASSQGSSIDTKEISRSNTAVRLREQDPMSLVSPALNMERHPTEINLAARPILDLQHCVSSNEVRGAMAAEKRTSRARPSAVFLMNKPLPGTPGSFGPKPMEPTSK